jgi:hypothetical protein
MAQFAHFQTNAIAKRIKRICGVRAHYGLAWTLIWLAL